MTERVKYKDRDQDQDQNDNTRIKMPGARSRPRSARYTTNLRAGYLYSKNKVRNSKATNFKLFLSEINRFSTIQGLTLHCCVYSFNRV